MTRDVWTGVELRHFAALAAGALASVLALALTPDPAAARPVSIKSPNGKVDLLLREGEQTRIRLLRLGSFRRCRGQGRRPWSREGGTRRGHHPPGGVPVLGYGRTKRVGELRCTSRRAGMTCWSARSSHGFRFGRGLRPKLF